MDNQELLKPAPPDWILIGVVAVLLCLGLMVVYSSTMDLGLQLYADSSYFFMRQLLWLGMGTAALILFAWLPYSIWSRIAVPMVLFAIAMLAAATFGGSGRLLFESSVSPSELAKLAVVVFASQWLSARTERRSRVTGDVMSVLLIGLVVAAVLAQPPPDLSEAGIIVLVGAVMAFIAADRLLPFLAWAAVGVAAAVTLILRILHGLVRLQPYLHGWRDPLSSSNMQLSQGLIALGSGGLFGVGPGRGLMAYQWLPAAHTDNVLAVVGEEFGFLGCMILLGLFATLLYRGLHIASRAPDAFGKMLAAGITCLITCHAFLNIAVVTGTIPFTGLSLPFISAGGSALVATMGAVGILLSISRASGTGRPAQKFLEQYWALVTNRDLESGRDMWVEFHSEMNANLARVLHRSGWRNHSRR